MKAAIISISLLFPALARAADEKPWGARLDLVSENSVITAGEPFEVGVRIHHREGFHTYWKNPGLVGFATKIDWKLPEGFAAGPIVWPPPELVDMAGNTAHGYHRDVMLTATITPPAELPQKEITLEARIAWMACADACYPGDEQFSLTLPVGAEPKTDAETEPLFAKARSEHPRPLDGWKAELLSKPGAARIVLQLTRTDADAPLLEDPYFFSSDGQVDDGQPKITSARADTFTYIFKRAEYGPKDAEGLPGLVAYGPEGDRHYGSIAP